MNFEELLETRDARKTNKVRLPYGYFYKRLIDEKYSNFVEFGDELTDALLFSDCVRKDSEATKGINDRHQLRFYPNESEDNSQNVFAVAVEPGNYLTLEQLLNDNPSIVARKDFLDTTVSDLANLLITLNERDIFQLCLAPSNILVRKNDNSVRLLLHGSFYERLGMNAELFEGVEGYVAPEVLRGEKGTAASDVYALAKFMEYLYASSGMPFELKQCVSKAASEDSAQRYASVADFTKAMAQRKATFRSALMGAGAILIALILAGLFFGLTPDTEEVEFVKPVEEPISEDLLDEGFDPATELGAAADSASIANAIRDYQMKDSDKIDERKIREFEAKGEQIFRKQYTKEAERILSGVYNSDKMNGGQKNFEAASDRAMQELVEKQIEIGEHSSLSKEKSQRIASEIIEQVTERKKTEMGQKPKYGIQK